MFRTTVYFCVCAFVINTFFSHCDGYRNIHPQEYLCADKLYITLQKPFRGNPTLTLTEDRDSAAIIKQVWNTTTPDLRHSGNNTIKYDCEFRVQTPEKPARGIYIVITKLKFRPDPVKKGACLDYIQFSSGNRSPSERICNEISIDGPAGRLIFDQRDREVTVHIHIDKDHPIHEPLELNMVLTTHSECKYTGDFLCDPKDSHSCISRHFVRDNIPNCMYPCKDEISCFHDVITAEEYDTTNVAFYTTNLTSNGTFNQTQKLSMNGLESEKGEICNLKIDFLKEKMNKEFELEEKKIKLEHDKLELEEKKLDFEKEKFKEEIEIKKLQIEKEEKIAKFDIEMKYKSKSFNQL